MLRNWSYLKYILRHKWFVFVAGRKLGCSFWRLFWHDFSKFRPSEWLPYARTFYAPDGSKRYVETPSFDKAWLLHIHRNPHHWQYWILRHDDGRETKIDIPRKFLREMVADWCGAGKAITGKWEVYSWYFQNALKIKLACADRVFVENLIEQFEEGLR